MHKPMRRTNGLTAMQVGRDLVILDGAGEEITRLDPTHATVWWACDGASCVDDIAVRLADRHGGEAEADRVFDILDTLADVGLLKGRVAPPVRLPMLARRSLLSRVATGAAAILAVATPVVAQAQTSPQQAEENNKESLVKQSQIGGKPVPEPPSAVLLATSVLLAAAPTGYRRLRDGFVGRTAPDDAPGADG